MRRLLVRQLRRRAGVLAVAIGAVVIGAVLVAVAPVALRAAIDDGIVAQDRRSLLVAAAGLAALTVAGGWVHGVRRAAMADVGQQLLHDLRTGALRGLLATDLQSFEAADRGDLQARLTSDVERLGDAAENLLPSMVTESIAILGGVIAVALLSPPLAAVAVLFLPPAALAGRILLRRGRRVYPELLLRNGRVIGVLLELVEGATTFVRFGAADRGRARLDAASTAVTRQALQAAGMRNRFYSTLLVLQSTATAVVAVAAGTLVSGRSISVGTASAAVVALAAVFDPLSALLGRLDEILAGRVALRRVSELAALVADERTDDTALPSTGPLAFDGVSFAYPGGAAVLIDLDLTLAPGERVALVGPTGAGKSTLARLAVGLASPAAGVVRLGGVDLRSVGAAARAQRLRLVTQETYLLDGSLADNIRVVAPDLEEIAIRRLFEQLGLAAWLDALPGGIDCPVGANGALLSRGERQFVALARALVGDPAVVVLDEATSAVDPVIDALLADALDAIGAGRVVLVIAHRSDTAARCARTITITEGRATVVS